MPTFVHTYLLEYICDFFAPKCVYLMLELPNSAHAPINVDVLGSLNAEDFGYEY